MRHRREFSSLLRLAGRSGKVLLALLLAVVGIEIVLRLFVVRMPAWTQDPILGKIMRPGPFVNGTEGFCRTTIGPYGFRNAEIPPKTMNEFRLVALGDSFTEANQLPDAGTFPKLLERQMAGLVPGRKLLALNAGKPGAYPGDYIGYKPVIDRMSPDCLIVQWGESDITSDLTSNGTTYRLIQDGGGYRLERGEELGGMERLLGRYSTSLSFVSSFSIVRRAAEKITLMQEQERKLPGHKKTVKKAKSPQENEAWEQERSKKVRWLLAQLKAAYPRHVCVYIPVLDYSRREQESAKVPFAELDLMQACRETGVVMVNMRAPFLEHFRRTWQPAHGFYNTRPGTGHLNATGHRLVAEALAPHLKQEVQP